MKKVHLVDVRCSKCGTPIKCYGNFRDILVTDTQNDFSYLLLNIYEQDVYKFTDKTT